MVSAGEKGIEMRMIRIVGFALFAALALCAFVASSAFATQWLVEGKAVETELPALTEGLLTLIKYAEANSTTVLTEIHCSGYFEGFLGGPGEEKALDRITDVYDLNLNEAGDLSGSEPLTSIDCEVTFDAGGLTDCKAGTEALLWVDGVNLELGDWWHTELLLDSSTFLDMLLLLNNLEEPIGYDLECESLLGPRGSELCAESESSSTVTNETGSSPPGVLSVFAVEPVAERVNCTMTGEHSASLEGEGITWALEGTTKLETAVSE